MVLKVMKQIFAPQMSSNEGRIDKWGDVRDLKQVTTMGTKCIYH